MKKLLKTGLLSLIFLLFATGAWSLPMVGNQVKMTVAGGDNYRMEIVGSDDWYHSFCVEKNEFFHDGGIYTVDSVGGVARNGGESITDPYDGGDRVSNLSKWFYASFFDGSFDNYFNTNSVFDHEERVSMVQNAIWYEEGEIFDNGDWLELKGTDTNGFLISGWKFTVANLVSYKWVDGKYTKIHNQSQLVGAPVPEPATMLLFGFGLLGIAGVTRKKVS